MEAEGYRKILDFFSATLPDEDEETLLKQISEFAASLVCAERATIFLLTEDMDYLSAEAALGMEASDFRIGKMRGIAGYVLRTGETLIIDDAYKDERFYSEIDKKTGFRTRSIICVPIIRRDGACIGVIEALNSRNGIFSQEDKSLLETLAKQTLVVVLGMRRYHYLSKITRSLREEKGRLLSRLKQKFGVEAIIGVSSAIRRIKETILKVADIDSTVLVTGETGTGKELVARALHYESRRATNEFVVVNCVAVPESLLEAELFGVERGVATGVEERKGKIESAAGGTLFLDEVGDMGSSMQAKLLRTLQERSVSRLGSTVERHIDVRFIAATNRNLPHLVSAGRFREDLYYRLHIIEIDIPPLRERKEDIEPLSLHFLSETAERSGKRVFGMSEQALSLLKNQKWEGNVRQLRNEIERAVILTEHERLEVSDFPRLMAQSEAPTRKFSTLNLRKNREEMERHLIEKALEETEGCRVKAAELLGISREALRKKLKKYRIRRLSSDSEKSY
ncbi:MAG: sigma-54-dependent Fis family transcriptional regulator [Planctomycetota bacterium]|nr:sigma-54-dependent Fis family transcriptional regulator [Planctomycetota bacterium]